MIAVKRERSFFLLAVLMQPLQHVENEQLEGLLQGLGMQCCS